MTDRTLFQPSIGKEENILQHAITPGSLYFAKDTGRIFLDAAAGTRVLMGRPVVATDEEIQTKYAAYSEGTIYFASDSGRIYLDTNEDRLIMGGSGAVIFYASDSNVVDTGYEGIYTLHMDSVQAGAQLKEDDVIINSDNCFYRITGINEEDDTIQAMRIAIAGSGGGGGTGGGTSGETGGKASVSYSSKTAASLNVLYSDDCNIYFNVVAEDSAGEVTSGGTVTWFLDNKNIGSQTIVNGENRFNVGPKLLNKTSAQTLKGQFSIDIGTSTNASVTKSWKITAIDVSLAWNYNITTLNDKNNLTLRWNVTGGASVDKETHIIIDEKLEVPPVPVLTVGDQSYALQRQVYGLLHGSHTVRMYVSFKINDKTFTTPSISKQVICVDQNDNTPIIALGEYKETMDQYDTIVIPIYYLNANQIRLSENGELKDSWNTTFSSSEIQVGYWSYTPTVAGVQKLVIAAGSVEYDLNVQVNELNLKTVETPGYAFKLKASDITSNNALKNWSYTTPEEDVVSLTFSENFDWVNGGLKTEYDENNNLRQFICIKSGTKMTINYKLFNTNNANGKCIKTIFKTANCGKYDAELINSCAYYPGKNAAGEDIYRGRGLVIKAQEATLMSQSNTITTQLCEGTYTEYEIDITPNSSSLKYIMPWLAGVPAGITVFGTDSFQQPPQSAIPQTNIEIGSEDSDIQLYLFKVYENHLTNEQHFQNFVMDALNSQEMLARYDRNNVLNDNGNGEIDWEKVVKKNPNCWVHLYKIPRICKTKKDKIGDGYLKGTSEESAKYYALYKDGNADTPVLQAGTDVDCPFIYNVQGTSSEKYVISASNLDTNFKKGFVDANGEKIGTFQLDDTVPGESFFNTKVNVASCEGANNALNADWYNKYQPYVSAAKKKNPLKRDTMNFKPGLIFMYDENPNFEITNENTQTNLDLNIFKGNNTYRNAPFYKQYAICNFGNSKKNYNTLHDAENKYEICIEVTDNQNIGQHMCKVVGRKPTLIEVTAEDGTKTTKEGFESVDITNNTIEYNEATGEGNDTYEWFKNSMDDNDYDVRYVNKTDGIDNALPSQIIGFFKLVQWFAQNDVSQYNENSHPYGWTGREFTAADAAKNPFIKKDTAQYISTTNAEGQTVEIENPNLDKYYAQYPIKTFNNKVTFTTGDAEHPQDYDTLLGGTQIATYTGKYYTDCHEYRMAKMLNECEEHLIMDSIIYHYLFIERHLMVDNVAKNTFWTSEDTDSKYWSLIKDYDNDTADGIDNSGKLSFTYGIEPMDIQPNGISYFNAPDSVWYNFVYGIESVRKYMFQKLNERGAWDVESYLTKFSNWQGAIPERCWIEDYYRKYIRPFEVFSDSTYLAMLEGGQKTLQRRNFETYQQLYLSTKYETNTTNSIYIRANSDDIKNINIPVTMYSDCYIYQSWSQNIIKIRAKRGETYTIQCPENISNVTDATIYWYVPQSYATIGNLGLLKPKSLNLGPATKLQALEISSGNEDDRLTSFTSSELAIGEANLIKHLILKDLSALNDGNGIELDLSNLQSLRDFDGKNSNFTAVKFPAGAPIVSIALNNPIILSMKDLTHLEDFEIKEITNLNSILIDNIDNSAVNSLQDIILVGDDYIDEYCLLNVQWKITDGSHIDDENHTIDFLESLIEKSAKDFLNQNYLANRGEALIGTLTIADTAYSGANSLEIYEKYINVYPNLNIVFESNNCKLYTTKVLDGNEQNKWERKSKTSVSLSGEFFNGGKDGDLSTIITNIANSKSSTAQKDFTFSNSWKISQVDENGNVTASETISVTPIYDESGVLKPSSILPITGSVYTSDIIIEPVFTESVRSYTISYYNEDGTETYYSASYPYGTELKDIVLPSLPTKNDSNLPLEKTYYLRGWSFYKNSTDYLTTYDSLIVNASYSFYAVFVERNVHDIVIDSKYLDFNKLTGYDGYAIAVKSGYQLSGKITLPSVYVDQKTKLSYPILTIAKEGFKNQDKITHIFWNGQPKLETIGTSAFNSCYALESFEYPSTLKMISQSAFQGCKHLEFPDFVNLSSLNSIGQNAYNGACQFTTEIAEFFIPSSVTKIEKGAFSYNGPSGNGIQIGTLKIGTQTNGSSLSTYGALGNTNVGDFVITFNCSSTIGKLAGVKKLEMYYKSSHTPSADVRDEGIIQQIVSQTIWNPFSLDGNNEPKDNEPDYDTNVIYMRETEG